MNRRQFLKSIAAAIPAVALPGCASLGPGLRTDDRPNIIFILIDDLGYTDLGCYGSTFYETPNIDALARQSMKFTNAYAACPVCSPTRASIMTGKYPARLHLTDWIPGIQAMDNPETRKLIAPEFNQQLPLEETTIAEVLSAGYTTAAIGKWHLGQEPFYPEHQGFDVNVAGNDKGSPPGYFSPYQRREWKLNLDPGPRGEYLTDRLTDEALRFIEQNKRRPFFLYLSHYAVHKPIQSKQALTAKYEQKAADLPDPPVARFRRDEKTITRQVQDYPPYAGMVESVDDSVGRVLEKLTQLALDHNTIVIFFSDNGGLSTQIGRPTTQRAAAALVPTANLPLRAGKGWLYEGGIREPLLIRWPGLTRPGSVCSEPVTSTDFFPTILEAAGLPPMPDLHKDGLSLVPLLKDAPALDRDAIYWHYPHYHPSGHTPAAAVRARDYKLIEFYEDNRIELYDLARDPVEQHDLSAEMPEKAAELRQMLRNWQQSLDASMPIPNPHYKGD
jgi:arylsulfatase A-like enzyme